jgi:sugar lactone lactonase YvrE
MSRRERSGGTDVKLVCDAKAELGEGPIWSQRDQAVYWVDIKGRKLHRYGLDGATASWPMPENISWVCEREDRPGFIAGFDRVIGELQLDPVAITPRLTPEADIPGNRLNDAKVDPLGRIWFGTMQDAEKDPSGSFYRLDGDFSFHREDTGYFCTNGPAFSPDGKTLYHNETVGDAAIYQFDLQPDGGLSNKRVFARFPAGEGYPDGMTTDAEGCLWVAHWDGWGVSRYRPDGTRERFIELPVSQVTSCTFAGNRLDRLFVTSARIGISPEKLENEPAAGGLFEIDPGVCGLPTNKFRDSKAPNS